MFGLRHTDCDCCELAAVKINRLRNALQPFATEAGDYDGHGDDKEPDTVGLWIGTRQYNVGKAKFSLGDLRSARSSIQSTATADAIRLLADPAYQAMTDSFYIILHGQEEGQAADIIMSQVKARLLAEFKKVGILVSDDLVNAIMRGKDEICLTRDAESTCCHRAMSFGLKGS